jgi:hypothetical protein
MVIALSSFAFGISLSPLIALIATVVTTTAVDCPDFIIDSSLPARLLLYPQNRVLCRLDRDPARWRASQVGRTSSPCL